MREKTDYFFKIPEHNIIPEILTDKQYKDLNSEYLLHSIRLRNYTIKRDFKGNKREYLNKLQDLYPHLKRKTLGKIINRSLNP